MKRCIVSLTIVLLMLVAIPALAQTLYDNGATDGNTWAWGINYGAVVSDEFNLGSSSTITGANFAMWLYPGDVLQSAEVSITSAGFGGGTVYFDQVVNFTQSGCVQGNPYGFTVCQESTTFNGPSLNQGTYWLNLQNAFVNTGDPVYWDQNSGPSALQCCERYEPVPDAVGTIPSESFTVSGYYGCSPGGSCTDGKASPPDSRTRQLATVWLRCSGAVRRRWSAEVFLRGRISVIR